MYLFIIDHIQYNIIQCKYHSSLFSLTSSLFTLYSSLHSFSLLFSLHSSLFTLYSSFFKSSNPYLLTFSSSILSPDYSIPTNHQSINSHPSFSGISKISRPIITRKPVDVQVLTPQYLRRTNYSQLGFDVEVEVGVGVARVSNKVFLLTDPSFHLRPFSFAHILLILSYSTFNIQHSTSKSRDQRSEFSFT